MEALGFFRMLIYQGFISRYRVRRGDGQGESVLPDDVVVGVPKVLGTWALPLLIT
jgi:hypothetical protein